MMLGCIHDCWIEVSAWLGAAGQVQVGAIHCCWAPKLHLALQCQWTSAFPLLFLRGNRFLHACFFMEIDFLMFASVWKSVSSRLLVYGNRFHHECFCANRVAHLSVGGMFCWGQCVLGWGGCAWGGEPTSTTCIVATHVLAPWTSQDVYRVSEGCESKSLVRCPWCQNMCCQKQDTSKIKMTKIFLK